MMHKIKNGSSFKKPLNVNNQFGIYIKMEIEWRWKLNKNRSLIKIEMETA